MDDFRASFQTHPGGQVKNLTLRYNMQLIFYGQMRLPEPNLLLGVMLI